MLIDVYVWLLVFCKYRSCVHIRISQSTRGMLSATTERRIN